MTWYGAKIQPTCRWLPRHPRPPSLQRAELEHVKAERAALLGSLAKLRNDAGKSGGELQQEDIRLLRRELEVKKEKLNELRRATTALDDTCVGAGGMEGAGMGWDLSLHRHPSSAWAQAGWPAGELRASPWGSLMSKVRSGALMSSCPRLEQSSPCSRQAGTAGDDQPRLRAADARRGGSAAGSGGAAVV